MKPILRSVLLLSAVSFLFTCTSQDKWILPYYPPQEISDNGSVKCAIKGNFNICDLESREYTIKTNIKNSIIEWRVISGDIKLISGQGTPTAVFSFGENFYRGKINCYVKQTSPYANACSTIETITYNKDCIAEL